MVLRSSCALLLTIQFASFLFVFFPPRFCPGHISGTVTRRLQIECAAWSCGLVVHCCLPSNSLCYFFFFFFPATILSGVEFFIIGGSLLGRIQGDREPVSFYAMDAECHCMWNCVNVQGLLRWVFPYVSKCLGRSYTFCQLS